MTHWKCLLITLLSTIPLSAAVTEKDDYVRMPLGSTLTFTNKETISIFPWTTIVRLGTSSLDSDGDGIPDEADWCSDTPAGRTVWTAKDAKEGRCLPTFVGCSGAAAEKWLFDRSKRDSGPEGRVVWCNLQVVRSAADRELEPKPLTVIDPGDSSVNENERLLLTSRISSANSVLPLLSTGGGTRFGLDCQKAHLKQRFQDFSGGVWTSQDNLGPALIGDLKRWFNVTLTKPKRLSYRVGDTNAF